LRIKNGVASEQKRRHAASIRPQPALADADYGLCRDAFGKPVLWQGCSHSRRHVRTQTPIPVRESIRLVKKR
jgi:hypothetical protein